MLRLILSGFITSAESAFTQWRDDLKGREKYEAAWLLTQGPCSVFNAGSCGLPGMGGPGKEEGGFTLIAQVRRTLKGNWAELAPRQG